MALQPDRVLGSTHALRYSGLLVQGAAQGVYPKQSGEAASTPYVGTKYAARFLLADSQFPTDPREQLPSSVFDNTQPAGEAPQTPVPGTGLLNASDLDISHYAWCKNTRVTLVPTDAAAAATLKAVQVDAQSVCLDVGPSSGLGQNTGLPVVVVGLDVGLALLPFSFNVFVEIEVRDSRVR